MAEFLSQEEVDAIMSALDRGDQGEAVSMSGSEDAPTKSGGLVTDKKVTLYNFRRPDRVSKEQLRSLEIMHENFARNLSVSLSGYLRALTEVNLVSVDQMTYNEFLLSLPNPTCFNIFSISPLEGNIVIEFNPTVAFPVLDRLLGGSGKALGENRALTDMELQMLDGFLNRVVGNLSDTWNEIVPLTFQIEAKETNPQVAQIVSLAEIVILMVFEIKIGEVSGFLNFCIPFLSIESIADKLSLQYRFATVKKQKEDSVGKVREMIDSVHIPVSVDLGQMPITIKELLELRSGDIINLGKSVNENLTVKISDQPKLVAKPGVVNRKKAVKVVAKFKD